MELNIYDTDLNALGVIDQITSLLWTRRYWSSGEFKLLLPFTEKHIALLEGQRIIVKKGDPEVGQIGYVFIRKNTFGMDEIEVQGRFLTNWLSKRVVVNPVVVIDDTQDILYRVVRENCTTVGNRNIPNLIIANDPGTGSGIINYASELYISVLFACEDMAKAAKLGFRITTNLTTKIHTFHVYKGRDLTIEQTENPPCVFSQEFDNVLEQEFTRSSENLKTAAYVGGETHETRNQIVEEIGDASGLVRDEVYIDASDIEQGLTSEAEYRLKLSQRGTSELSKYEETLNFSSHINPNVNLIYKEDFDVGDRVTCIDKRWGVKINVRITQITEIYQKDMAEIDVVFGESLPTLTDKLGRR